MPVLTINNQATVTTVANPMLNVTFSGTRLNILTVAGPMGPPGHDGTGGSTFRLTGVFPIYYDQGSGVVGLVSGYYARFGDLTGASGALQAQIVAASAGVVSLNGLSGVLTLAGTGSLFVTTQGQRLTISGSGFASLSDITGLSGWANSTFATIANLASTGQQLGTSITSLSGVLTTTGSNLQSQINTLTSNLALTGSGLYTLLTNESGALNATIAVSGQQAWSAANTNGVNLSGNLAALSGNLTLTGAALSAVKVSGSAVIPVADFSGIGGTVVLYSGNKVLISGATPPAVDHSDGVNLSGSLIQTGVQLVNSLGVLSGNLTATGAALSAVKVSGSAIVPIADFSGIGGTIVLYSGGKVFISGAGSVDHGDGINLSGNLQSTGSYLLRTLTGASGYIISLISAASAGVSSLNGASGVLILQGAGNVTVTTAGQTITVSGNTGDYALFAQKVDVTQTGIQLIGSLNALSGYAEGIYVHRTGAESITGIKTFLSELRFNSGLKTPARYFGAANYTLASGDFMVIATGAVANVTGILPPITVTDYSGVLFTIVNGRTTTLPISGIIGGDVNPILNQYDAIEIYGGSGVWHYIRQTGSPIWADANNNGINLSGALAQTGATLITRDTNISGAIAVLLTATGQTLLGNIVATSGSLALTGQNLYAYVTATSGFATGASGYLNGAIASTGQQAWTAADANGRNLSGNLNALSGNLTLTGAALSAVKVSGSSIIPVANFSGLGGVSVIWSGNTIFVSGVTGTAGGGGGITQGQLDALSGFSTGTFATITNLAQTGSDLQAQIRALTGLGTSLAFDFGRNIVIPSGTGSLPVTFSRDLGSIPLILPVLSNNSGDPTLACYPSGATSAGFTLVFSATVPTSGYRLSYIATTGSGYIILGQNTGSSAVSQIQLDAVSGYVEGAFVHRLGNESITGIKTFISDTVLSGNVGVGMTIISSPTHRMAISGVLAIMKMIDPGLNLYTGGAAVSGTVNLASQYFWDGSGTKFGSYLSAPISFFTNNITRVTIDPAGNLNMGFGEYAPAKEVSASYATLSTDNRVYLNNPVGIIVTLGNAATVSGQLLRFKLMNTGAAVLTGTYGQKFDGSDSYVLNGQYSAHELHSNGANWCIW